MSEDLKQFHEAMVFITDDPTRLNDEVTNILTNDDSRVGLPISNKFFESKETK